MRTCILSLKLGFRDDDRLIGMMEDREGRREKEKVKS